MTDEPGFLSRWSRRKAASRPAEAEPPPPDLPPVKSLNAGSDFAAFLQKGVTAELQRQALAVAWRTDPVIAGFRGMADYDWDFNAPGYGKLRAVDDVAKLLRAVLSPPLAEPDLQNTQPPAVVESADPQVMASLSPLPSREEPEACVQQAIGSPPQEPEKPCTPRRHGSALPA